MIENYGEVFPKSSVNSLQDATKGRNIANQSPVIIKTINRTLRAGELRLKTPDLNRSNFFRNKDAYKDLADLLKERGEAKILVVGLGRLEEPLGYLTTYYHYKGSFDGCLMKLIDVQEKEHFIRFSNNKET